MLTYHEARHADGAHLSGEQLLRLRELLGAEAAVQSAQRVAHETAGRQLRDLTDGDSVLERELAEAGARRAQDALAAIQHALERLRAGTYGRCESCGAAVPFERLEAIPSARCCVTCLGFRAGVR